MLRNSLILFLFFTATWSCLIAQKIQNSTIKNIKSDSNNSLKTENIEPIFSFGNFKSNNVSVEDFKKDLAFIIAEGYVINNMAIYFTGAGFPNIIYVGIVESRTTAGGSGSRTTKGVSVNPTVAFKSHMDKLTKGSIVVFDNIKLKGKDGIKNFPGRKFTLY